MSDLHVIEVRADGFTLQHPLVCRPRLFECSYNRAAERLDVPPCAPGLYVCLLDDDDELAIVRPATDTDLQAGVLSELLAQWQDDQLAGVPSYPNGTGKPPFVEAHSKLEARFGQQLNDDRVRWIDVLGLSAAAVFAESDPAQVRRELLGLGANVISWINDIDRQAAAVAGENPSAQEG